MSFSFEKDVFRLGEQVHARWGQARFMTLEVATEQVEAELILRVNTIEEGERKEEEAEEEVESRSCRSRFLVIFFKSILSSM